MALSDCPERAAYAIIFAIITAIAFIIAIGMVVDFVIHHYKTPKARKGSQTLLKLAGTVVYLILNALVLLLFIPYQLHCDPLDTIYPALIGIIPGPICCLMVFLWYSRLHSVFSYGELALSRGMIIYWYIYFAILFIIAEPIHFIAGILLMVNVITLELWSSINSLAFVWIIVGIVGVTIIFVNKLIAAYKHVADDDRFIQIMTKISILTAFSFGITIISTIISTAVTIAFADVIAIEFFKHYCWIIDFFTNSLVMVLSYEYSKKWYTKLCNCPHLLCHRCFKGNISQKKLTEIIKIDSAEKTATEKTETENTQTQSPATETNNVTAMKSANSVSTVDITSTDIVVTAS